MNNSSRFYLRVVWQDICTRPAKLLRCVVTLTLCVIFLFISMQLRFYMQEIKSSNDYFVYMKVTDTEASARLLEHLAELKGRYGFTAQVYCHAGNGDGIDIIGMDDASGIDGSAAQVERSFYLSNELIPPAYDLRTDEITMELNGMTYTCMGKAAYLSSDILNTLSADEVRADRLDLTLSVNPSARHYSELDVFINLKSKMMYEEYISPFRPAQIVMSLDDYRAAGIPVYGAVMIFDQPLSGEARDAFLHTFGDVPYKEYRNMTANSISELMEKLEKGRFASSVRLLTIVTLFLFLQLVSWKIWISDLRKLMETCHIVGIPYWKQQALLLGLFAVMGLAVYLVGAGASYLLSVFVLQPMLAVEWRTMFVPTVLVIFLAALLLYSLYCLSTNIWRISRKETVL